MSRFHPSISWNTSPQSSQAPSGPDEEALHGETELAPWHDLLSNPNGPPNPSSSFDADNSCMSAHVNSGGPHETVGPNASLSHRSSRHAFFVPMHYEKNYAYPLVVWLHNDGFNENQIDHVMPHVSLRNYVGAGVRGNRAADSIGHRFDWHHSPAAIEAAHEAVIDTIEDASDHLSIHPRRIVLAGYQSGGTMAMRIAMREPDRFAAAISLGGHLPTGQRALGNLSELRQRRLPMLWQWASENRQLSQELLDRDIRWAMMMRSKVEIRQYAGDDEMNTVALADLNEWVMSRVVAGDSATAIQRWASSPTAFSSN